MSPGSGVNTAGGRVYPCVLLHQARQLLWVLLCAGGWRRRCCRAGRRTWRLMSGHLAPSCECFVWPCCGRLSSPTGSLHRRQLATTYGTNGDRLSKDDSRAHVRLLGVSPCLWLFHFFADLAGMACSAGKACVQVGADDVGAPICPHEPLPGELGRALWYFMPGLLNTLFHWPFGPLVIPFLLGFS